MAVALVKALPESDPRSFYQQANVHCAYCAAAYRQAGRPQLPLQIHYSWLFFPFHRAYLYFFERVAARLLGDPGFAVPFWSWDVPEGMRMPPEFADVASPLYDPMRNPEHAPPRLVDLDFSYVEKNCTDEQQIQLNLLIMYKQMVTNAPLPSLFHGQLYYPRRREPRKRPAAAPEVRPLSGVARCRGDRGGEPAAGKATRAVGGGGAGGRGHRGGRRWLCQVRRVRERSVSREGRPRRSGDGRKLCVPEAPRQGGGADQHEGGAERAAGGSRRRRRRQRHGDVGARGGEGQDRRPEDSVHGGVRLQYNIHEVHALR
ncbi:unnamed protein product [Miscanthus lutarioriparius]|uniref:Tyrosinase copper-binding domain-containing protein n=1 Tax=Miscanthus lutarioriparius TaxID=422564 RepID=A0A811S5R9_9POAL|nr:unnamed protein product [Miscanthus lutarioriparius]